MSEPDDAEAALRAALVQALTHLRDDPDKIERFVERLREGLTTDA